MNEKDVNHIEYIIDQFIMKLEAEMGYYSINSSKIKNDVLEIVLENIE